MQLASWSRRDPVARLASEIVGGPVGRHARSGLRGGVWAASVLTLLGSLVVASGALQKNHCVRSGWGVPDSLWRMCYSDLAAPGQAAPAGPYAAGGPGANQPFLTAMPTWLLQRLVPSGVEGLTRQQVFFALAGIVIVLCVAAMVVAVAWATPGDPWSAAHVAISPVLVTSALVSLDLFGVALMTIGIAAWIRGAPAAAGALLGAAVMARSFPLVVVFAIALICARDGRVHDLRRFLAAGGLAVAVCFGLALVIGGSPLAPYRAWLEARPGYGSLWRVVEIVGGVTISAGATTVLTLTGWILALAVGAWLAWRRPVLGIVPIALVMLVVVMVTAAANPVQQATWVLPFLAFAAIGWSAHLSWAGAELVAFAATWLYVAAVYDPGRGLPGGWYAFFVLLRLVALAGLAAWVVRSALSTARAGSEPRPQPTQDFRPALTRG